MSWFDSVRNTVNGMVDIATRDLNEFVSVVKEDTTKVITSAVQQALPDDEASTNRNTIPVDDNENGTKSRENFSRESTDGSSSNNASATAEVARQRLLRLEAEEEEPLGWDDDTEGVHIPSPSHPPVSPIPITREPSTATTTMTTEEPSSTILPTTTIVSEKKKEDESLGWNDGTEIVHTPSDRKEISASSSSSTATSLPTSDTPSTTTMVPQKQAKSVDSDDEALGWDDDTEIVHTSVARKEEKV